MPHPLPDPTRLAETIQDLIRALEAGARPSASPQALPCFEPSALQGDPRVSPGSLDGLLGVLTPGDIPTLRRALFALEQEEQTWLGFKLVSDPEAATQGPEGGSADPYPALFLVSNASGERQDAEILCGRPYSDRDRRQMLDITRGPQMHGEQFPGLSWKSLPLFRCPRLFIFGGGVMGAELAQLVQRLGFATLVIEDEASFLSPERFPSSERILIESFDAIPDLGIRPEDYACILTRGHVHDPQALLYAIRAGAVYVGMMGRADKNRRIFELAEQAGISPQALERVHAPIGLRFGAKSPAELAVSIAAELIQVRRDLRSQA